ncbi:uncharacterized protein METZ01_LOCUS229413, partial [marine metagenome]
MNGTRNPTMTLSAVVGPCAGLHPLARVLGAIAGVNQQPPVSPEALEHIISEYPAGVVAHVPL